MRRRAVLALPLALAACGFAPVYAPGGAGAALRGRVAVEAPDTPDGARLRAALEDRLGAPGPLRLAVELQVADRNAGTLPSGGTARLRVEGRASWRLLGPDGAEIARGTEEASASAVRTGPAPSVRAAAADARGRVAVALADRIVARLLALEGLP